MIIFDGKSARVGVSISDQKAFTPRDRRSWRNFSICFIIRSYLKALRSGGGESETVVTLII
jgi:hypothetical protein